MAGHVRMGVDPDEIGLLRRVAERRQKIEDGNAVRAQHVRQFVAQAGFRGGERGQVLVGVEIRDAGREDRFLGRQQRDRERRARVLDVPGHRQQDRQGDFDSVANPRVRIVQGAESQRYVEDGAPLRVVEERVFVVRVALGPPPGGRGVVRVRRRRDVPGKVADQTVDSAVAADEPADAHQPGVPAVPAAQVHFHRGCFGIPAASGGGRIQGVQHVVAEIEPVENRLRLQRQRVRQDERGLTRPPAGDRHVVHGGAGLRGQHVPPGLVRGNLGAVRHRITEEDDVRPVERDRVAEASGIVLRESRIAAPVQQRVPDEPPVRGGVRRSEPTGYTQADLAGREPEHDRYQHDRGVDASATPTARGGASSVTRLGNGGNGSHGRRCQDGPRDRYAGNEVTTFIAA